jgi:hypothetical protein
LFQNQLIFRPEMHPGSFFVRMAVAFLAFFPSITRGASVRDTLDLYPERPGTLVCWKETWTTPRLMQVYYLRIDLTSNILKVMTLPGEDPDGPGPAESTLTPPSDLFEKYQALAAVNANAFAGLPGTEKDIRGWYRGRSVDIQGMAVCDGQVVSPEQPGRTPFWIGPGNRPHTGDPSAGDTVLEAVSDWGSPLLKNNRIIPDSTYTTLHPRTALGFDSTGQWLLLVVVDGRQPGFSEGISLHELAEMLRSKGCTDAINLDGGGSSIMLIRDKNGKSETYNSPSGLTHRPVPILLGIVTGKAPQRP